MSLVIFTCVVGLLIAPTKVDFSDAVFSIRAVALGSGAAGASAAATPEATALKLDDFAMSYAELDRAARGVAHGLAQRGVGNGDRVALLVPNVPEFTIAYFGILYAGAVVVPVNVLAAAPEVTYFIQDSGAKLLIAHPLFGEAGEEGARGAGVPCLVSSGDGDTLVGLAQGEAAADAAFAKQEL